MNFTTRFDNCTRLFSVLVVLVLLVTILMGVVTGVAIPKGIHDHPGQPGDGDLYARVIDRVAAGESYYPVVTAEQRTRGYPLHPAVTVREPTLAVLLAALPSVPARRALFITLGLLTLGLWGWRLKARCHMPLMTVWGLFSLYFACQFSFYGKTYLFHECWAALLLAISLACQDASDAAGRAPARRGWLIAALISALAACLIRELAAPFLLVMAVAALMEKRSREGALWGLMILIFAGFLFLHSQCVAQFSLPADRVTSGWSRFHGWSAGLMMAHWNAILLLTPPLVSIITVPLMLLGAAAWPGRTGLRLAGCCFGYSLGFCLFGRLNTAYWGLISTPLMGLALIFAPPALLRLARNIRNPAPLRP